MPKIAFNARSFYNAITSPLICSFIAKEKLVKSDEFRMVVEMLDEHFSAHRDSGGFERLLNLLDGTRYRDEYAAYLRSCHGVMISRIEGTLKVVLQKNIGQSNRLNGSIKMNDFRSKLFSMDGKSLKSKIVPTPAKKKLCGQGDIDMLDHPARLGGSFGHGRRR